MIDEVVVAGEMRFESQFSRRNCQTFSCASSSGHLAGSGTMLMLWGTVSCGVVCHPA